MNFARVTSISRFILLLLAIVLVCSITVCGVYINEDLWNSIPEEYRVIIQEEFDAGQKRMVQRISDGEAATMEKLENEMGITFNEVDSAAFRELVMPIYEEMEATKGTTPGLYQTFQDIIAEMPQE